MQGKDIENAKKELASLYLILKLGKKNEVNYKLLQFSQKKIHIEEEINELIKKPLKELIQYIKDSIDIIISIKLNEELEKINQNNKFNLAREYELLLQKEEQNNREHISIEHQFRIQCEKYAQELDNLEEEKIVLLFQIVSIE